MTTIDQKMEDFQSKPYDEKLNISMNAILNRNNRGNKQIQEIYGKLSQVENLPEMVINVFYRDFCNSINRIRQQKMCGEFRKFDTAKVYMQKLQQEEKKSKNLENIEALLDGLNYL